MGFEYLVQRDCFIYQIILYYTIRPHFNGGLPNKILHNLGVF